MHIMIRKILLAASVACLCVGTAFPAFADGPGKTTAGERDAITVPVKEAVSNKSEKTADTSGKTASDPSRKAASGTAEKASADASKKAALNTAENKTADPSEKAEKTPSPEEDGYVDAGPGAKKKEEVKKEAPKPKETSLGMFTITGYCGCGKCSGSHSLTYSGTVPTANHTISADLNMFPLGTKLKIDGIVYTVEDKGSAVKGKTLDIYYDTHEEALAKGRYTAEVFLVND